MSLAPHLGQTHEDLPNPIPAHLLTGAGPVHNSISHLTAQKARAEPEECADAWGSGGMVKRYAHPFPNIDRRPMISPAPAILDSRG